VHLGYYIGLLDLISWGRITHIQDMQGRRSKKFINHNIKFESLLQFIAQPYKLYISISSRLPASLFCVIFIFPDLPPLYHPGTLIGTNPLARILHPYPSALLDQSLIPILAAHASLCSTSPNRGNDRTMRGKKWSAGKTANAAGGSS
jgi:hypothetical protein